MRAGEVVSRTDIWEHVYDFRSDATSNVVDVYIGHLRRKIDREGEPSFIETVRGRGYVLRKESSGLSVAARKGATFAAGVRRVSGYGVGRQMERWRVGVGWGDGAG